MESWSGTRPSKVFTFFYYNPLTLGLLLEFLELFGQSLQSATLANVDQTLFLG